MTQKQLAVMAISFLFLAGCGTHSSSGELAAPASHTAVTISAPPQKLATTPACAGLTGLHVGTRPGDQNSPLGLLFALEHRFFTERNPDRVMQLAVPAAELNRDNIATAINYYPHDLHYCVAVTYIADQAVFATIAGVSASSKYRPGFLAITTTAEKPYMITGLYSRYGILPRQ